MPPRIRLLFSVLLASLFLVSAVPLYTELSRRSDIWWTPRTMLVPLAQSGDRVEIYARGRPLGALLEARQILIAEDARASVLTSNEVGLRFNNRDRVRADGLPVLLASAVGCSVTALLFLVLVTGSLAYRGERGA